MKQDLEQKTEAKPPETKGGVSGFRLALLFTAIPAVILSVISLNVSDVWIFAGIYVGIAFVISIILLLFGDSRRDNSRSIASGIMVGVGISIIALGATCFANIDLG